MSRLRGKLADTRPLTLPLVGRMPGPVIHDDGSRVTVDLHGYRVHDAMRVVARVLQICKSYGRSSVRIIHGTSTSGKALGNKTIKEALYDALDRGDYSGTVTTNWREDGSILLALPILDRRNPKRITASDLER